MLTSGVPTKILNGWLYFLQDRFLSGVVRVLGPERGGVRVRIPELSSTSGQFSYPKITSHPKFSFYRVLSK
jgi:hypothetical protein